MPERFAVIQLNPPLPMVTPKGEGWAHFLIDYGPESPEVRMYKNWTLGRQRPEDARKPQEQPAATAGAASSGPRFRPSLAHQSDS